VLILDKQKIETVLASYRSEMLKFGNEYKIAIFGHPKKLFSIKDIVEEIEKNPESDLAKMFIESRWEFLKFIGVV
jgi:hypothetical protein